MPIKQGWEDTVLCLIYSGAVASTANSVVKAPYWVSIMQTFPRPARTASASYSWAGKSHNCCQWLRSVLLTVLKNTNRKYVLVAFILVNPQTTVWRIWTIYSIAGETVHGLELENGFWQNVEEFAWLDAACRSVWGMKDVFCVIW